MRLDRLGRGGLLAAPCLLLAFLAGCAPAAPPAGPSLASPVPPGVARIWFYRDMDPYESLATPVVHIDGAAAGVSDPGGAFYRDVAPGRHQVSVDSYVDDGNQTRLVDLASGSGAYVRVVPFPDIVQGGGEHSGGYHRNSYYLWLYPPEAARPAIAHLYLEAGGPVAAAPR
jgi:hypothetical protein